MRKAAAGAIPAAAAVALVAVSLSGCGASQGTASTATQQYVVPPVSVSAAQAGKLPQATTYTTVKAAPTDPARFATTNGLVVHPLTTQIVYAGPGKAPIAMLPATELGGPTWVPVVQTGPGWDQVLLPSRPDHSTGWIYTAGAARLDTRRTSYLLRVNLAAHQLSVYDNGKLLGQWTVAIGAPATPTPTGRTFLLALLAPPDPTYSPLIVPLGAHSNALSTYGGGPGTVGIHGWPDTSVFGHSVSNGCVRVPSSALQLVSTIPLGSLVVIS